ncbi:MAG: nucleotidyltransferase family protein [Odoribacter sp.]|nr:nucleotidyltransferase family protein [Odoribacter sp.]
MQPNEWLALFQLAEKQHVLPLIYEAVYNCPAAQKADQALFSPFKQRTVQTVMLQAMKTSEFLSLYQSMRSEGVVPIVVNGIICRNLYPNPDYRISGDEDILIPQQLIALVQNEDWYGQIPTSNPAWAQRVIVVLLSIGAIDEDCIGCKVKKNNSKSEPIQVRGHIYKCENCHIFFKSFRRIDRCRNCGYYLRGAWIYEGMVEYYRRCEKEMLREDKCEVVAGDDAAVSPTQPNVFTVYPTRESHILAKP